MPVISPLLVSAFAIGAAVAIATLPMPIYVRRSIAAIVGWFGVSYGLIYYLELDLPAVSLLSRFNLILLFGIIIACSAAWHWGQRWKRK